MPTVVFDEERAWQPTTKLPGGLAGGLVRIGVVSTLREAQIALIVVFLVLITLALWIFTHATESSFVDPNKEIAPALQKQTYVPF